MNKKVDPRISLYVYLDHPKGAVFLNRWDEVIKRFDTYSEAEAYAKDNLNLIDERVK